MKRATVRPPRSLPKTSWLSLLFALTVLAAGLPAGAQNTVAYFNGPYAAGAEYAEGTALDLNQDGRVDFTFSQTAALCTTDIPVSACSFGYCLSAQGTNAVLARGGQSLLVTMGELIGAAMPTNSTWAGVDCTVVATAFFSPRFGTSGWGGPLGSVRDGYLGVRFQAADGVHYGWLRAWLPPGGNFLVAPVILEGAYETRPNTPLAAGVLATPALLSPRVVRANHLRLEFPVQTGRAYQVQFKEDLALPGWTNLDFTLIATGTNATLDVPTSANARFYRVVQMD